MIAAANDSSTVAPCNITNVSDNPRSRFLINDIVHITVVKVQRIGTITETFLFFIVSPSHYTNIILDNSTAISKGWQYLNVPLNSSLPKERARFIPARSYYLRLVLNFNSCLGYVGGGNRCRISGAPPCNLQGGDFKCSWRPPKGYRLIGGSLKNCVARPCASL